MDYKTIPGVNSSLISAGHTYSYRRPNLTLKLSKGERLLGDIVQEICDISGIWGIYSLKNLDYDPNYHKISSNEYKRGVRDIVKQQKIKKFVEIRGFNGNNQYDIEIYYKSYFKKSKDLANLVRKAIDRGDLNGINILILRTPDGLAESLADYVSDQLRVPSVELNISNEILNDKDMRNSLSTNLAEFLTD